MKQSIFPMMGITTTIGRIHDAWERNVERLESCSTITMDSEGHEKLRSKWHEMHLLMLMEDQLGKWLVPETKPKTPQRMVMQFDPTRMKISEVIKKPKTPQP